MDREEIMKEAIRKAIKVISRMKSHNDILDVTRIVRVTDRIKLEVNCIRNDYDPSDCDIPEDYPLMEHGKPMWFEIYLLKNGIAEECETIHSLFTDDFVEPIRYMLGMYL